MPWNELLTTIFELCLFPLLGALTVYLVSLIRAKADGVKKQTNNELAKKYLDMLEVTVVNCVLTTNQTYVDALKAQGAFDAEAQKVAFQKTYEAVSASLTEEGNKYLAEITNDIPAFITEMIEAQVAKHK
jgi:hypothetical protein